MDSNPQHKKLVYQASYRGTKEADLLLGSFVREIVAEDTFDQTVNLEHFLTLNDFEIFATLFQGEPYEGEFKDIYTRLARFADQNNFHNPLGGSTASLPNDTQKILETPNLEPSFSVPFTPREE